MSTNTIRPPYQCAENFLQSEQDFITYDFKNESTDEGVQYEKTPISKWLKLEIDTDQHTGFHCDNCALAQSIYQSLWDCSPDADISVHGDEMNSFWTSYRCALELCVEELSQMETAPDHKDFIYKFALLFGGLGKNGFPMFGIETQSELTAYFKEQTSDLIVGLEVYVNALVDQCATRDLERIRLQWIMDNEALIKKAFKAITHGEEIFGELEKLASLTHTIGNFTLVPNGYHTNRYASSKDYWDLSLEQIKTVELEDTAKWAKKLLPKKKTGITVRAKTIGKWAGASETSTGEELFKSMTAKYYLSDYVADDLTVLPLFEHHTIKRPLPRYQDQMLTCLKSMNTRILSRGEVLVSVLKTK